MVTLKFSRNDYSTSEFLCTHFYAFFATIMFLGAERWYIPLAAAAIGFVFDRLRKTYGADYDKLATKIDAEHEIPFAHRSFFIPVTYAIWASYTATFFTLQTLLPEQAIRSYLDWWRNFHELIIFLFRMPRHHFAQLVSHGYEYRALITVHAYSIAILFMLVITAVAVWQGGIMGRKWFAKEYLRLIKGEISQQPVGWAPTSLFAISLMAYLVLTFIPINFMPNSAQDWVPHLSNAQLIIYQGLCGAFVWGWGFSLSGAEFARFWFRHRLSVETTGPHIQRGRYD